MGGARFAAGLVAACAAALGACTYDVPPVASEIDASSDSARVDASADANLADAAGSGDSSDDSADGSDVGDAPGDPGVHCGTKSTFCPVVTEVCCRIAQGGQGYSDTCTLAGMCAGAPIACDDSADCATIGQPFFVCCATLGSNGTAAEAHCVDSSQCGDGYGGKRRLCDPQVPGSCPAGMQCEPSGLAIPGYYECK